MSIIKILDKRYSEKLGHREQWILFKCPICKKEEEKTKSLANQVQFCKTCGNIQAGKRRTKHGGAKRRKESPLYSIWKGIKSRCYTRTDGSYKYYGACGVTMCEEWKNDFQAFANWADKSGYYKGAHLDKDELCKNLDISPHIYSPKTCQWIMQHKNNIVENQLHTNEKEYEIVQKYKEGKTITELAEIYYIGKGKSYSAPTKYIEELLKRYGVYNPKTNRTKIPNILIEQILQDDRPLNIKLQQCGISKSKWYRALKKYKQAQN